MDEFERAKFYGVTIEELRVLEGIVEKYNGGEKDGRTTKHTATSETSGI